MKLHSITVNKKADVESVFGKKLAAAILKDCPGQISQAKPRSITLYTEKPAYYLNDGETLSFYAIDFVAQRIIGRHYAGSGDTTIHHAAEQLSEGSRAPGDAVIAVRHFWNGKNMSWTIDVISDNVRAMLPASKAEIEYDSEGFPQNFGPRIGIRLPVDRDTLIAEFLETYPARG